MDELSYPMQSPDRREQIDVFADVRVVNRDYLLQQVVHVLHRTDARVLARLVEITCKAQVAPLGTADLFLLRRSAGTSPR